MGNHRIFDSAFAIVALAACQPFDDIDELGSADAYIGTTTTIPSDGACAHIVATRLADFHVSEHRGPLTGAAFKVATGETRVTATAYPQPCSQEPAEPPWLADAQVVEFTGGANTLMLSFHRNASVDVDPVFDDDADPLIVETSRLRIGRNGEDAAGPEFALDGWEVKQLTLPPAAPAETVVFSMEGQGGLPYSPRGLARLPDGRFVAQVGELDQPLRAFSATGTFLDSWPVTPGAIRWDFTDGLEAIDATHFVRTGWLNTPIHCAADGTGCVQSGIEILELAGSRVTVIQQITLPELPDLPLNTEFAVGVTPVGGRFAVTTLPTEGGSRLILLDADGTLAAGPTPIPDDVEGLFVTGDGRLGALDYHGRFTAYHATDASPRPGETASYPAAAGVSNPNQVAWDSATGSYLVLLAGDRRLVTAPPTFASTADLPIDLSGYANPSGMDYLAGANQVMIADRIPPADPATNTRIPSVDFYDLPATTLARSVRLQGVALPARTLTIASVAAHQQIASHYRRPGGVADAALDARVYLHDLDGSLATTFDLAPLGFVRVVSLNYLAVTDELLIAARDSAGTTRLVVTSPTGQPRRSFRTDAIAGFVDLAQHTNGPDLGDLGVVLGQPSEHLRVSLRP